jgi:Fe-S-cluster-containing hydrogenase component 2
MTFLMAHGIGEATNVLIIDEELCVGCDNCEQACAATHQGISRLDRKAGPSFYSLHIPASCRHCESSHCMRDCPPDAIQRLSSGEVYINSDSCIGCGNCVENCPYEVIKMAEVSPQQHFWDKLFGNNPPEAIAKTAVKCDMCKDFKGGMACVNACPTGAAIRIHAEQMMDLASKRAASCY